jgi:hypothetical protein
MRWAGNVVRVGQVRDEHNFLVGKREGKSPLGRYKQRWKVTVRIDLREIVWNVWNGFIWLKIGTSGRIF